MSESRRIADQLRRSYEGIAWHGPSLKEVLDGVTAEIAARHTLAGAHSIHEITLHVAGWAEVAHRAIIEGGYDAKVTGNQDWPPAAGAWEDALARLDQAQRSLVAAVRGLDDQRLMEIVSEEKKFSCYFLVHGVVQHNLYHAGQIAILKK